MFRSRAAWDEHMQQPYNTAGNKILETCCASPQTCACSTRSRSGIGHIPRHELRPVRLDAGPFDRR